MLEKQLLSEKYTYFIKSLGKVMPSGIPDQNEKKFSQ